MATLSQWVEGARPRTLPAAVAPVLAGSAVAVEAGRFAPGLAVLALVVSLAMQIGVNYANDYSDGIRGTDDDRVGPLRLVGSGAAAPRSVKRAAFASLGVGALAGVVLSLASGSAWLVLVGAACVAAAWYYTGGPNPYGYRGWGEVFVFVFFGLVAVGGTAWVQTHRLDALTLAAAIAVGCLATAILVANNLRDLDGDRASGKHTLAVALGDTGTRRLFVGLAAIAAGAVLVAAVLAGPAWLLALGFLLPLAGSLRAVLGGARGAALIGVLKATGIAELVAALGMAVGAAL